MPPRRRRNPRWNANGVNSEHEEQMAVVAWANYKKANYPDLDMLYAIPMARMSKGEAGRMKGEGARKGFPDLGLAVARQGYHGLFIEMKVKGGEQSEQQVKWQVRLEAQGYKVVVPYGCEEACREIAAYLDIPLDEWEWLSAR